MNPPTRIDPTRPLALGLVYRPTGTPGPDRSWARALVVRQARADGVTLLDVFEVDDDRTRNGAIVRRLADLAATAGVEVLITEGIDPAIGRRLSGDLKVRHAPVPPPPQRPEGW